MSAAVEAIIFDLSEVCLRGLKGTNRLLGAHLGLAIDDDAFLGEAAVRLFHGEIGEEEYLQAIITANRWAVDVIDLKRLVRQNFDRIEGTETVVECLKAHGYRLGLLSVHAREWVYPGAGRRGRFPRLEDRYPVCILSCRSRRRLGAMSCC
jgi:hypothetical protein